MLGIAAATLSIAGPGDTANSLGNPGIAENVFMVLAHPVMGPAAIFLSFAILLGAMASINSTAISPARKLLAFRKCAASWPGGRYQHTQTHPERT